MQANVTIDHLARDRTRDRILEVALQLIADRGFAATSTREISESLGFTKAALYYHFRTKDDLLEALLAPALASLQDLLDGATRGPSRAARRQVIAKYVDLVISHEDLIRVLANDPSARRCPVFKSAHGLFERFAQILSGTDNPGTAERTRVRAAIGAVHAAVVRAQPGEDRAVVRCAAVAAACGALGLYSREGASREVRSVLPKTL